MNPVIDWFEIPVSDFARAQRFYERMLDIKLTINDTSPMKMGIFPYTKPATGGAIVKMEGYESRDNGVVIYLNGGDDLSLPLQRAIDAGGKVLLQKTSIAPNGYIAMLLDSEGNRIGLHSMS